MDWNAPVVVEGGFSLSSLWVEMVRMGEVGIYTSVNHHVCSSLYLWGVFSALGEATFRLAACAGQVGYQVIVNLSSNYFSSS